MNKEIRIDDIFEELTKNEEIKESVEISKKVSEIIFKLIKARIDNGLTQRELAKITGIKQSAIARIEKVQVYPRLDTILKLAHYLNVDLTVEKSYTSIHINFDYSVKKENDYYTSFYNYGTKSLTNVNYVA